MYGSPAVDELDAKVSEWRRLLRDRRVLVFLLLPVCKSSHASPKYLEIFWFTSKKNWYPSRKVCFRTKATFSSHLHNDIVMNNTTILLWIMQRQCYELCSQLSLHQARKKRQKLRQIKRLYRANPSKAQTWSKETPKEQSPFHPPSPAHLLPQMQQDKHSFSPVERLGSDKKGNADLKPVFEEGAIRASGPPIHSPEFRPKSSKTPQKRIYGLILGPWWWKKRPTTQAALIETETWRNKHSL